MTAPSITEFLLARIAEDEVVARAAAWVPDPDEPDDDYDNPWAKDHGEFASRGGAKFTHILRNDPARVLAECAAKRAIVKADKQYDGWEILFALAAVYADHPDYSPEWAL